MAVEHAHFRAIPTAKDIQPEAPAADVVDGHRLFGREQRVHGGQVRGGEHGDLTGQGCNPGSPGVGFETDTAGIVGAAETFPAADRYEGFKPCIVGNPGDFQVACPIVSAQAFRRVGDGAAALGIGGENTQLYLVRAAAHRVGFYRIGFFSAHRDLPGR